MATETDRLLHLGAFLARLDALNDTVAPRLSRSYQVEILQKGRFELVSPWTGAALAPVDCYIANNSPLGFGDLVIAYRFQCVSTFWLITGIVKDGFPINEVFLPETGDVLWELYPGVSCNLEVRAKLKALEDRIPGDTAKAPPVLLLGHPNFAHTIWNELPGLAALEEQGARFCDGLTVESLCQPIMSFEDGFGSLGLPHRPVRDLASLLGLQPRLYTRIGSTRISCTFRSKLQRTIRRCRSERATGHTERRLHSCHPVVWLSVRLDSRTAVNQEAFLHELVQRVVARYPRAGIVLDGFAFPDDFANPMYLADSGAEFEASLLGVNGENVISLGGLLAAREREVTRYIAKLGRELSGKMGCPVVSTSGLTLTNAIYLAGLADYYVCHAGTLQHKIGWVYNTPGIVHSNTEGIARGADGWMANQVEGGRKPALLDAGLVSNADTTIRAFNQVERNRDYRIDDIDSAVSQVLCDMAGQLPSYRSRATEPLALFAK